MADEAASVAIDTRGMRCPWPVVRLARAVREGATMVTIRADDPIAPSEIAALAASRGWSIVAIGDDEWCIKSGGNPG